MPYITTAERYGRAQGLEEGLEQGLAQGRNEASRNLVLRQATKRFGPLSEELMARITVLPVEQVEELALALLDFTSSDDLVVWLDQH